MLYIIITLLALCVWAVAFSVQDDCAKVLYYDRDDGDDNGGFDDCDDEGGNGGEDIEDGEDEDSEGEDGEDSGDENCGVDIKESLVDIYKGDAND